MSDSVVAVEPEAVFPDKESLPPSSEEVSTPLKVARAAKRKCLSPVTPEGRQDGDLMSSARKRRKSTSNTPQGRTGSPRLKPALTERQQMALIMQMTDPQKQGGATSGGEESVTGTPRSEPSLTPRSRIQRRNERGETLLHTAAIKGDMRATTSLIEQGADVNATDNADWTPLHEACNHGHTQVASLLLKHHAEVNARGMDGDTPLHDATINGHLETVQLLLEHHADPYQENDNGISPINACKNPDILRLLQEVPHRTPREDSEEEEVFVSKVKQKRLRASYIKKGSKGSSRSSGESLFEDEDEERPKRPDEVTTPQGSGSRAFESTPKSRPRNILYSDLSSSDSESEHKDRSSSGARSGVHKVRYHLAKMGEAKQKLLGKLEESGEVAASDKGATEEEGADQEREKAEEDSNTGVVAQPALATKEEKEVSESQPSSEASDSPMEETDSAATVAMKENGLHSSSAAAPVHSADAADLPAKVAASDDSMSPSQPAGSPLQALDSKEDSKEVATSPPPTQPETTEPVSSEEDVPPTRLLRSAVKKAQDLREQLVVSVSLKLVRGIEGEDEGKEAELEDQFDSEIGDMSRKFDGKGTIEPVKSKLVQPERSDSTSSVDSRSSGVSKSMAAKHGRKSQQAFSKLTVERSDSTSSIDSHSSISRRDVVEKGTGKHKKQVKKTVGEDEFDEDKGTKRTKTLSISVDWGALPSNMSLGSSSVSNTPTGAPTGGFSFPSEAVEGKGKGKAKEASPTLVSLPLHYSARADSGDGTTPSTSAAGATSGATPRSSVPPSMGGPTGNLERLGMILQKVMDNPVPPDKVKQVIASGRSNARQPVVLSNEGLPFSPTRGRFLKEKDLPPRMRLVRQVAKSYMIEQRKNSGCNPEVPTPPHLKSFLIQTREYRSMRPLCTRNPKGVYPPIYPCMYRLFREQDAARAKLVTEHFTQQEYMVVLMEEQILKAHKKATKGYTDFSVCAFLLEEMMIKGGGMAVIAEQTRKQREQKERAVSSGAPIDPAGTVDYKLLSGLVQDIWDKFQEPRMLMVNRQKNEAETMWVMQKHYWVERLREMGKGVPNPLPPTHVPLATPILFTTDEFPTDSPPTISTGTTAGTSGVTDAADADSTLES